MFLSTSSYIKKIVQGNVMEKTWKQMFLGSQKISKNNW